jgi:o-succinylbenzoate synthase
MQFDIKQHILHFKQRAGNSRAVYTERKVWYVTLSDEADAAHCGVGECAPLPQLSCDDMPDAEYEELLSTYAAKVASGELTLENLRHDEELRNLPSMLFGLESALWHYERRWTSLSATAFARGERGISINGLIWMGSYEEMQARIDEKLRDGFHCVKLKIGAINFTDELHLLKMIRSRYSAADIELRVDANGAFLPGDDAMRKLEQLSRLDLHSIEQPIAAGQWDEMARLCENTPLPIALDEELIGVNDPDAKAALLNTIRPQYIILKPSLHGGLCGSEEWIDMAEQRGIGWWATSALESNVGLNAIAHWCAMLQEGQSFAGVAQAAERPIIPQGLGTGMLFTNNRPYPLAIKNSADGVPALFTIV